LTLKEDLVEAQRLYDSTKEEKYLDLIIEISKKIRKLQAKDMERLD